jgi:hypothetical protein
MDILSKNIKKIMNEENRTKVFGLLTILIALWLVLYFIPQIFASLFNTLLGNLILVFTTILTLSYNLRYGLMLFLILIILYRFSTLVKVNKESFTDQSLQDFLLIQNTINRQKIFDTDILQTQATQEELDYFNSHGMWPWSDSTIELYISSTNKNPYIRTYSKDAIGYARTIYNEKAILELLSNQTNEGLFKINGVQVEGDKPNIKEQLPDGFGSFPYTSGLMADKRKDIIKCNLDSGTVERKSFQGRGGIFGEQLTEVSPVNYTDLPKLVPGFSFLSAPCNPCSSVNDSKSNCQFKLNVKPTKLY